MSVPSGENDGELLLLSSWVSCRLVPLAKSIDQIEVDSLIFLEIVSGDVTDSQLAVG